MWKTFAVNKKTQITSYYALFGQARSCVKQMLPFGFLVLYSPPVPKLPTFGTLLSHGITILQERGVVHFILTSNGTIRTNQVRFEYNTFLGRNLFNRTEKEDYEDDSRVHVFFPIDITGWGYDSGKEDSSNKHRNLDENELSEQFPTDSI